MRPDHILRIPDEGKTGSRLVPLNQLRRAVQHLDKKTEVTGRPLPCWRLSGKGVS